MKTNLLGGITPKQFLANYWQKKPLLVRQAIPGFAGPMTRDEVLDLACDEEAESRLIQQSGGQWRMQHGPFKRKDFKHREPWTALVQGVNLLSDAADALLQRFDFVPAARLDDLMVSYATDGGGVGPHFDSYDVFLLQGVGQRRWKISNQRDLTLVADAPLKILQNFQATEEWVLEPGDMLYLPPHYAHDGTAVGECMTWSIGFRAPSVQELATGFLDHLINVIELPGRYADPDLKLPRHRGEIGGDMLDKVEAMIEKVRWDRGDIREFLGCYLTEPKRHVFFDGPQTPLTKSAFVRQAKARGVRLDRKTQLLFSGTRFFINGETADVAPEDRDLMRTLADKRVLAGEAEWSESGLDLLFDWHGAGFAHLPPKK